MGYDQELSELYRNMDSGDTNRPNVEALKANIQETIHCMEMSYGTTGSLFRSGSRQTFFAASVLNLLYYPTFYMFRSPAMLLPHESTVSHQHHLENQDTRRGTVINKQTEGGRVANGQEPSHTHDMDDDDLDAMEEVETSSDQSN